MRLPAWFRGAIDQSASPAAFLARLGIFTTGKIFYVGSTATGALDVASNAGDDPDSPFATIDYAIGKCTANKGDVILVLPGHAETVSAASGIDFDVAGVTCIGLGEGAARPAITMSAVASTIEFAAASVWMRNFVISCTGDTTIVCDVNAADCVLDSLDIRSSAGKEFVTAIDINGGGANVCDRTVVRDCTIASTLAAGAARGVELGEVADRGLVKGCTILGDYSDAAVHNITGKVLTNLAVEDCFLENTQTGDHAIELVSACTGRLTRNLYKSDMTQATAADTGSCFSYECYHDDAIDVSAILSPAAT